MDRDVLVALVRTIELKDRCTAAHTWRVVLYARAMAESAGMGRGFIERLSTAAALHDIGKIDVPDAVLMKPGGLTDDEFEVMKSHTTLGHARLVGMGETDSLTLELVLHHHERWDGSGYPDGLGGEAIPEVAAMFAVVDAFDAMTGIRPYRAAADQRGVDRAVDELERGRGSQFSPAAVDRFLGLHASGSLGWILDHFNDERDLPGYGVGEMDGLAMVRRVEVGDGGRGSRAGGVGGNSAGVGR